MALPNDFAFAVCRGEGDWDVATFCGDRYHIRMYHRSFEDSEKNGEYGLWRIEDVEANINCGEWVITEIYDDGVELHCDLEEVL